MPDPQYGSCIGQYAGVGGNAYWGGIYTGDNAGPGELAGVDGAGAAGHVRTLGACALPQFGHFQPSAISAISSMHARTAFVLSLGNQIVKVGGANLISRTNKPFRHVGIA
jgi:hypothetical protein